MAEPALQQPASTGAAPPLGTPAPAAATVPPAAPTTSWWSDFQNPDAKGVAELKGWKTPEEMAIAYHGAEKLIGAPPDRVLRIPDKADAPEWAGIWNKLGVPETADKYEFPIDPAYNDPVFAEQARTWMLKHKIPAGAAKGLVTEWNGYVAQAMQEAEQNRQQAIEADIAGLKKEWGQEGFVRNTELAQRAARQFGVSQDEFSTMEAALGPSRARKLFGLIGSKMAENEPMPGDAWGAGGNRWTMTPEAAKVKIEELRSDKDWSKKYLNGDKAAAEQMLNLQRIVTAAG